MLNNVILVGRTTTEPTLHTFDSGAKAVKLDLAVQRPFKNESNEYDTDFVPVSFWHATAEKVQEYCGTGSLIGVVGRFATWTSEKDGVKSKQLEVVADRVIFLNLISKNIEKKKEE